MKLPFSFEQVKELASKYKLYWRNFVVEQLMVLGVRSKGDDATPHCELYRQYFSDRL